MRKNILGNTKIKVSQLGIGLSEIGSELSINDDRKASELLNFSLDNGINFLDTASCYGVSEELIGKTVSHRRHEYYIASKAGHANGNVYIPTYHDPCTMYLEMEICIYIYSYVQLELFHVLV